ncbi:MAG: hypothetical protein LBN07_01510 [Christensenellaceae bacterium]|jgi:hypothetical protein|nr:hypothetical protein [Christensenellaceae bacterium]
MNIPYFTNSAYSNLKENIKENKDRYIKNDDWLKKYFMEVDIQEFYKTSSVYVNFPTLLTENGKLSDADKCSQDLTNVKILYSALKDKISPQQASNYLMWTAVAHMVYPAYILARWQKDYGEINFEERFFATRGRQSLIYYNAISRLWWCGYISYDEECKNTNPFHLTEVLFTAQEFCKDFTDTAYSMNKTIARGVLRAVKGVKEKIGEKSISDCFRDFNKYFNRYGAVTVLDYLSEEEVTELTKKYMLEWFKNH